MSKKLSRSKSKLPTISAGKVNPKSGGEFCINKTIIEVQSTFPNLKIAKKVSHTLLKEKLIACANILPTAVSIYEWDHKVETASEVFVIFKTTKRKSLKAMERLLVLHPYECPSILELQPIRGFKPYLNWVENIG